MRIGCSNVLVELQIPTRERQTLITRIRQQLEELVQHTSTEWTPRLQLSLQVKRVEKSRRGFAITFGEQQPRDRDQLILFPGDLARRPRLFQLHEDFRRVVACVLRVVKQTNCERHVGRITADSGAQFLSVSSEPIVLLEKVVELFRQ